MLIKSDSGVNTFNDNNICLICYDELDDNVSILNCGHKYHYNCILLTYKNTKSKTCPYCRSPGGYLKLEPGIVPEYNIHKEYVYYKKNDYKIELIEHRCKYILVKGKNKGNQCSFKHKEGGYCTRHFKMLNS